MMRSVSLETEAQLVASYLASLPSHRVGGVASQLRCALREFHVLFGDDPLLAHVHTTQWVSAWRDTQATHISINTITLRLQAVRQWLCWLFARGDIDDNALACASPKRLLEGSERGLVLRYNLQRPIAVYLGERGPRLADSRAHYRCALRAFNVFINRHLTQLEQGAPLNELAIVAWLRNHRHQHALATTMKAVGIVNGFLEFLVETGRMACNPLTQLLARYPGLTRRAVLVAVLNSPPGKLPSAPAPRARFVSPLGPQIEAHLTLMRALGRRYVRVECILSQLDGFLAKEPERGAVITRDLLNRWLASRPHLAPGTLRAHASAARQFCRFLARVQPDTWIPDKSFYPVRVPKYQPYIFSVDEIRQLLAAALRLPAVRWPLRPQTFYTLLLVLYGTGLRISEALGLRIRDVDLDARTFFIAETKFFKSRWVPFSADLGAYLGSYLAARTEAVSAMRPDDPFFISSWKKRYGYTGVAKVFRRLLLDADIRSSQRQRGGPRLHGLRHAFASHCLLRWYRAGEDVQAKLPLLATYLGHTNIAATQVYLTATGELLQEACQRFETCYGSTVTAQEPHHAI